MRLCNFRLLGSRFTDCHGQHSFVHGLRGLGTSVNRLAIREKSTDMGSITGPMLCAEQSDGSVREIEEGDLYRYTKYRWLFNESRELSMRYLKFDLRRLLDIAVTAVGDGATSCVRVLKCVEGLHNKALLLTMDNGVEVLAKLPNPNAGPAHYTTASEVATRKLLLEGLGIPVPRVYTWSSDPENPVGAEYIIEEKAPGKPLSSLWYTWPRKRKLDIIAQVTDLEQKLASTTFSRHGCIYFRDDLPGGRSANKPLVASPPLPNLLLDQLSIGPLTTAELWKGERSTMALARGPWSGALDFIRGMALNEAEWVRAHATPRMNYHRSMDKAELPDELLALLSRYMDISHHLVPPTDNGEIHMKTLWHPDLHLDNVFVDPDSSKITRLLDWQSAAVAPLFLQCGVPKLFRHSEPVPKDWVVPERPANYDELSADMKAKADHDLEGEIIHKYYNYQTFKKNPRHWAALSRADIAVRTKPVWLVSGVWQNRDVFFLRQALIHLARRWEEIEPHAGACPISFTEQELELHAEEDENMTGVGELLRILRDEAMLPADGMVHPADFDRAREMCEKYRAVFLGLADGEEQRRLFSKIWPFQDSDD